MQLKLFPPKTLTTLINHITPYNIKLFTIPNPLHFFTINKQTHLIQLLFVFINPYSTYILYNKYKIFKKRLDFLKIPFYIYI